MKAHTVVKIAISCGLIALILAKVPLNELVADLLAFNPGFLALSIGLSPLLLLLKMYKWYRLLRDESSRIAFKSAALSLLCGIGVGLVTPGRAGEVTRALFIRSDERSKLVGLVIVDRLLDLIPIVICAGVSVAFLFDLKLGILLVSGAVIPIYLLYDARRLSRWLRMAAGIMPLGERLSDVIGSLDTLNGRLVNEVLVLAGLIFLGALVQFYLLLSGLTQVPPAAAVVSFPLVTLAAILPITVSGLGTREGIAMLVLHRYGVAETAAVNAAFLSFCLNTLAPGIVGAILISSARLPSSHIREGQPGMPKPFEES